MVNLVLNSRRSESYGICLQVAFSWACFQRRFSYFDSPFADNASCILLNKKETHVIFQYCREICIDSDQWLVWKSLLIKRNHHNEVIMSAMVSHITSLTIKHSSLAFVRGIHRWPVNSPHKGPVTWKMFPFDDVIMTLIKKTTRIASFISGSPLT